MAARPEPFEVSMAYGATACINVAETDPRAAVSELTGGWLGCVRCLDERRDVVEEAHDLISVR